MTRMRRLSELLDYIKQKDPDTALTNYALRRMVLSGAIPHTPAGRRKLINLDILDDLLDNPDKLRERMEKIQQEEQRGKIRRVC